jgi:hypothetical protein
VSKKTRDYGVDSFTDYKGSRAFFERFNVSLGPKAHMRLSNKYVDFTNGEVQPNFSVPASNVSKAAILKYLGIMEQYESITLPSYANFPAPGAIPDDLLMKFSDFVAKYNIQDAVNSIFEFTGCDLGDLANTVTLYVMQAYCAPVMRSLQGLADSYVPTSGRNQELYDKIATFLGDSVLYSSVVTQTVRNDTGVELHVRSEDGTVTQIHAKKLLVSFEPTPANTDSLSLDDTEASVFSAFRWSSIYTALFKHPSLPANSSFTNIPEAATQAAKEDNYFVLPNPAFIPAINYVGDGIFAAYVVGLENLGPDQAKGLIKDNINSFISANTIPTPQPTDQQEVEIVAFANHGAMHLRTSADALRAGHIQKLYALQGRHSTFWTGAAWSSQYTSVVWEYNNAYLLPKLMASF